MYTVSLANASQYEVLPPLRCIEWFGCSAEKQIGWACVFRVESLHVLASLNMASACERSARYMNLTVPN
jgi:hypothetical protein